MGPSRVQTDQSGEVVLLWTNGIVNAASRHVREGACREDWIRLREDRGATLPLPDRMLAALRIILRGRRLPPAQDDGETNLKLPVNRF